MAKAIREADGKKLLARYLDVLRSEDGNDLGTSLVVPVKCATVLPATDLATLVKDYPWLETEVRLHTLYNYIGLHLRDV